MRATSVDQIEKILVKWCCGRSSGTTSLVKRTAVKEGTIAVGQKVTIAWGKSKKTYPAEVVSVSGAQTPAPRTASRTEEEVFSFQLAAPAQQTSRATTTATGDGRPSVNQQHLQQLSAILEKLDSLSDAVSRSEARLLLRLDALEGTVAALQKDMEKYAPAEGTLVPYPLPCLTSRASRERRASSMALLLLLLLLCKTEPISTLEAATRVYHRKN